MRTMSNTRASVRVSAIVLDGVKVFGKKSNGEDVNMVNVETEGTDTRALATTRSQTRATTMVMARA